MLLATLTIVKHARRANRRARGESFMRQLKGWHLAMVALAFALLGGGAAALWMRHQKKDEAKALVSAARGERVDGEVGVGRNVTGEEDAEHWLEGTQNMPASAGGRAPPGRHSGRAGG